MTPAPKHSNRHAAFTRIELIVVLVVVGVMIYMMLPFFARVKQRSGPSCVNYLKQLGTAYQIWANDHQDLYPSEAPIAAGGWRELTTNAEAGLYCWTNYVVIQNELGQSPGALNCPTDERRPAPMSVGQISNNLSISYFVGLGVGPDSLPQSILAGDRNLGPGPGQDLDYGYSPTNDRGNDVAMRGPVCWSVKMHSKGSVGGVGNILLADGSAQQATSVQFRENFLKPALAASATNHIPMHLIFP